MENDSCPEGTIVAELRYPTKERVQSILLPKNTNGRVVTLHLPGRKDLRFREVEIYNGALPGKGFERNEWFSRLITNS